MAVASELLVSRMVTSTSERPEAAAYPDLQRLAHWLDAAFVIPGTRHRVGFDGLIGLVPGVGDLLMTVPALYLVMRAVQIGVPTVVVARMLGNLLLENVIGTVPVVGDLFDIAWKANLRNLRLVRAYGLDPAGTRRRSTVGLVVAGVLLLLAGFALVLVPILVLIWLIGAIGIGSV
jgi:hypothetical protein